MRQLSFVPTWLHSPSSRPFWQQRESSLQAVNRPAAILRVVSAGGLR